MTYEQALEKIHSLNAFGSRPGLDRISLFLERLGNPQDKLKFIHVAGTNGKGSVCVMLSSVLTEAGYKTGLFVSPYIIDFRERIQINNEMISRETLTQAVEETYPVLEQLRSEGVIITEFEYVNALEFYIHSNENCDVVVLETGMGGLLDSTNVIKDPLCSVITTIGLDHTDVLGSTIEEITAQKCGIIKPDSCTVCAEQDDRVRDIIIETADKRNNRMKTTRAHYTEVISSGLWGSEFSYNGAKYKIRMAGRHQIENAKVAIATLSLLKSRHGFKLTDENAARGLYKAFNPARLELIKEDPIVILDGAHNPNGMEALVGAVSEYLRGRRVYCVCGMLADKDVEGSVNILKGAFEGVYTAPVNNPRTMSSRELADKFAAVCPQTTAFATAQAAFDAAYSLAESTPGSAVVVCGSLYFASQLRPFLISGLS